MQNKYFTMQYTLNQREATRENLWSFINELPAGLHEITSDPECIFRLISVMNSYALNYRRIFGDAPSPSGWPVIKLTDGRNLNNITLKAYEHEPLFYGQAVDVGKPGRKPDPASIRGNVMIACQNASIEGTGNVDIRYLHRLSYIRTLVSLFNAEHGVTLKVSNKGGRITISNPDIKVAIDTPAEIIMPDILAKFLKNETTIGFTITDEEYDELKNELQGILNKAKSKRSLI